MTTQLLLFLFLPRKTTFFTSLLHYLIAWIVLCMVTNFLWRKFGCIPVTTLWKVFMHECNQFSLFWLFYKLTNGWLEIGKFCLFFSCTIYIGISIICLLIVSIYTIYYSLDIKCQFKKYVLIYFVEMFWNYIYFCYELISSIHLIFILLYPYNSKS